MAPLKLQVGERRFTTNEQTLVDGSSYFEALLSGSWKDEKQEDGSLFVDRDGDIFAYILGFLRSSKFPLFYDDVAGFDHDKYVQLLEEARYFGIDKLVEWIKIRQYEKVIKVQRRAISSEDVEEMNDTVHADHKFEYFPNWETRKVYVCPRGIGKHRGQPGYCGRQCRNAQNDDGPEYEEEGQLMMVEIRSEKIFNRAVLDSSQPKST